MEKFAAEKFCTISQNMGVLASGMSAFAVRLTPQQAGMLKNQLESLAQECKKIGLRVTALQIEAAMTRLEASATLNIPSAQAAQIIDGLATAISCEMETHLFLRVFPERAEFYENDELFGSAVKAGFQSANKDIKSAGTCYACDRNTACVMHLMRVLEVGLNALAKEFPAVVFERRNWENIINDIESEIKKITGPAWGPDWKAKLQFYSGTAKDFRYFKDAWRNHVMHFRDHYEANEAKTILDHIKVFMMHLADNGLHE